MTPWMPAPPGAINRAHTRDQSCGGALDRARRVSARLDDRVSRPYGRYRVVELPGPVPALFGKTFADLGAEVIKVEPPSGDPARSLPPFARDGETSLFWTAYSLGKQSIVVDLDREDGRGLVRQLAACADVLVEAFPPGYLAGIGLGPERLRAENPQLVVTSISSFGQDGPFAGRQGSDLVHFAMSGYLNMTGPADGPPIKPSAPYQTLFHGSMQAVAATLLALRQRRRTGLGAHVDQAMRDTGMWMLTHTYQFWDLFRMNLRRQGASRDMGGGAVRLPGVWRARDGYIVWVFQTGHIGGRRARMLVDWMAEEGMAPAWMLETDWESFDLIAGGPEMLQRLIAVFTAFFATKSRAELFEWAIARGVMLAPMQTLADVVDDRQLAAREAWREPAAVGGEGPARVPGPPVKLSAARWEPRGAPPALGGQNAAIYGGLLGLTGAEMPTLGAFPNQR
jgi:benzylsuccinate CoA-transferase BbsE subunit